MLISYYLPPYRLTNEDLEREFNNRSWTADKIYSKTGIKERRTAGCELVSDMAVKAAELLFEEYQVDRGSIDMLVLCTQSPDHFLPSTSCIVQNRLALPRSCGAFDINLGCSGYVYGLAIVKGLLLSECAQNVLLITSETYSKHINRRDRSTRTIFGDAATATLLLEKDVFDIGSFVFGTDGSGASRLIVPSGAMIREDGDTVEHEDPSGNVRSGMDLFMDGPEIYGFTLETVPKLVSDVLLKNGMDVQDIDQFVLHQANRFILEALDRSMLIPTDKFIIDVEDVGNTVSSSIPIAIKRAMTTDPPRISHGSKILVAGFGVGYSWAGTVIQI